MSSLLSNANFPTDSFVNSRGLRYEYIHIPPTSKPDHKPYVLILHGFPSIPTDFRSQIQHLSSLGYPILAPYLLGYYPTSTPTDPTLYTLKSMSNDIVSLLDHLKIHEPVNAIGHDWGSTLLSRFEYYHPTRLSKLAYLTVAPVPFGQPFDLDAVNKMTEQMLGYAALGYQKFFMDNYESGRAARLLEEKHERMEMVMFAKDEANVWRDYVGRIGGLEEWILGNDTVKVIDGMTEEDFSRRRQTFCVAENTLGDQKESQPGYAGPLNWYVSHTRNFNVKDEQSQTDNWEHYTTDKDVLMVLSDKDPIAIPDMHAGMANSNVRDASKQLRIEHVDAGHFLMLEQANQVNKLLEQFFEDK